MKGNEIRERFLEFFQNKGHRVVASYSLIPENDPSLLLIGAGMAPLKPYFTGAKKPPSPRLATCQKCVRTGDIERVGQTARHNTFLEMLGNFSFGDYFKVEAITWAWEFFLKELKIDSKKLWVSVFEEDQEAWDIWRHTVGLPADRIVRLGREDNFWEIGVGPCGPCSEIYYDMGPELGCGRPECKPGCDCDRYLEVWNLVFTQFDKDEEGNYNPLPHPNIDTGMGLERIASVLQGARSNYECDLIYPLIEHYADKAGIDYMDKQYTQALRVVADHFRGAAFLLADGVLPSNEGRGYVLRRLLRRAVRKGIQLGFDGPFLYTGIDPLLGIFGGVYPELGGNRQHITVTIKAEEERFHVTIQEGMELLNALLEKIGKGGVLDGRDAFRLYDTFGFPLELTVEIAGERGVQVDEDGFRKALEVQRSQGRAAREQIEFLSSGGVAALVAGFEPTVFTGYSATDADAEILALFNEEMQITQAGSGETVYIVLDATPFYPEGGGQVGDRGVIKSAEARLVVEGVSASEGVIIHKALVKEGVVSVGAKVKAQLAAQRRDVEANHTATHLLHHALGLVLGDHVRQAGSLVEAQRLRFDFTHPHPLSVSEIERVEQEVNALIGAGLPVVAAEMTKDEAIKKGATALFGEKYGEQVRVVSVGSVSMELCGGTHVANTAAIRGLKIVSETGIGAGLRRIEAVTGTGLLAYYNQQEAVLEEAAALVKSSQTGLIPRLRELLAELKEQKQRGDSLAARIFTLESEQILAGVTEAAGVKVLSCQVTAADMAALRAQSEQMLAKLGGGVVVLAAVHGAKVDLVAAVSKDLVAEGVHAGRILKEIAKAVAGDGGGRADLAQAGGKDPSRLPEALALAGRLVATQKTRS